MNQQTKAEAKAGEEEEDEVEEEAEEGEQKEVARRDGNNKWRLGIFLVTAAAAETEAAAANKRCRNAANSN